MGLKKWLLAKIINPKDMGYKSNGISTGGIPVEFVKTLKAAVGIPYFVETGTAGGKSVNAVYGMFKECHTIELVSGTYSPNAPNIKTYVGDSVAILPQILGNIPRAENILFWLDAHYCGSVPAAPDVVECPLLDELRAISVHQRSIILIDDARLFLGAPNYPNDPRKYPKVQDIFALCRELFPYHTTTVMDDYIFCYPDEFNNVVMEEWRGRFKIRYPDDAAILKQSAQRVWTAINEYLR